MPTSKTYGHIQEPSPGVLTTLVFPNISLCLNLGPKALKYTKTCSAVDSTTVHGISLVEAKSQSELNVSTCLDQP